MKPQLVLSLLVLSASLTFACKQKSNNNGASDAERQAFEQEKQSIEDQKTQIAADKANVDAQRAAVEAERKKLEADKAAANPAPIPAPANTFSCAVDRPYGSSTVSIPGLPNFPLPGNTNSQREVGCNERTNGNDQANQQAACANAHRPQQGRNTQWFAGACPATVFNQTKVGGCRKTEGQNTVDTWWWYTPYAIPNIQSKCAKEGRTYVSP